MESKLQRLILRLYLSLFCYSFLKNKNIKHFGFYSLKNASKIKVLGRLNINDGVYVNGKGGVVFGDNVMLSAGCKIISTGLEIHENGFDNKHILKEVKIGNNVQIGAGVIVLPGVCICDNVVIGAGAVVSKNIQDAGVYVGNPVRKIRSFN